MWNKVHILLFKHRLEFLSEQCQWKVDILINTIYFIKHWISLSCYYEMPSLKKKKSRLYSTGNWMLRAVFKNPRTWEVVRVTAIFTHHQPRSLKTEASSTSFVIFCYLSQDHLHAAIGFWGCFSCNDIKYTAKHKQQKTKTSSLSSPSSLLLSSPSLSFSHLISQGTVLEPCELTYMQDSHTLFTQSKFWVCKRGRKSAPQLGTQGFVFIAFVNFMLSVKGIKMRSLKLEFSFPMTTCFFFMLYHTRLLGFHPFIIDIGHLKHSVKTSWGSSNVPQSIILASNIFRSIFIQVFSTSSPWISLCTGTSVMTVVLIICWKTHIAAKMMEIIVLNILLK